MKKTKIPKKIKKQIKQFGFIKSLKCIEYEPTPNNIKFLNLLMTGQL